MNEAPDYDRLEAELAALRPHDASPELRQRIANHRAHSTPLRSRWRWGLTLASGVAAVCVAAAIFFHWGSSHRALSDRTIVQGQPELPVEVADSGPTRLAYQRALARSPEAMDALLDKDAMAAQKPNPELVPFCLSIGPTQHSKPTRKRLNATLAPCRALPAHSLVPILPRSGAASGYSIRPRRQRDDEVPAGLCPPADPG